VRERRSGWTVAILWPPYWLLWCSPCAWPLRCASGTVARVLLARFLPITPDWDPTVETVVWQVRLPRALAGALVGASLAAGGAVFQGLFHNPLVSPYVLGVSSGQGLVPPSPFCSGRAPS